MPTPKPRCVIYARYSDEKQNPLSIRDQISRCRKVAQSRGWTVIQTYEDAAITGSTDRRPGYQQMRAGIEAGLVDIVLTEALDRLTRDQAEAALLYQTCSFRDVEIHTLSGGHVSDIHVGITGTMNALYLKELARKTHRGLEGRVRDGNSAGGRSYGYRVPVGAQGLRQVGQLEIVPGEALVIARIFREFADGASPLSIATALNREGIPSPSGKHWKQNTIYGNRQRGTGILNNELYVGTRVWNRLEYRKDPKTKRRVSRHRPEGEWIREEVPHLRVIDDALWHVVKERQGAQRRTMETAENRASAVRGLRRKSYLLSGLVRCGCCGGRMVVAGSGRSRAYYCSDAKQKGDAVCGGMPGIRLDRIEPFVFDAIRHELMRPEAFTLFRMAYASRLREMERELTSDRDIVAEQLRGADREIARLTKLLTTLAEKDLEREELLTLLVAAEARRTLPRGQRDAITSDLPSLPENVPALYRAKIDDLVATLSDPEIIQRASETLGALIDRIVVRWDGGQSRHTIEIVGDLVGLLGFSNPGIEKACAERRPFLTMVAGARNERVLQTLAVA